MCCSPSFLTSYIIIDHVSPGCMMPAPALMGRAGLHRGCEALALAPNPSLLIFDGPAVGADFFRSLNQLVVVTLTISYLHTLLATLHIHLDRLPRKRRTEKGLVIKKHLEKPPESNNLNLHLKQLKKETNSYHHVCPSTREQCYLFAWNRQ
jgi:hypothetical protein